MTDVHGTTKNNGYIPMDGYVFNNNYGYKNYTECARIVRRISENVCADFIINLGDTINSTSDEGYLKTDNSVPEVNHVEIKHRYSDFTRFIRGSIPYFACNAHHELFPLENSEHMTKGELYGISGRSSNYINKVYNDKDLERNYYYFDIYNKNIRCIVLDSVCDNTPNGGKSYSTEEISWVRDVALNTNKNVVVFSHIATRKNISGPVLFGGEELAKVLNDFNTDDHKILAFYHGHTHWDNIVLPSESGDKFPYISTEKAWCTTYTPSYDGILGNPSTYTREYGKYNEYAFDVNVLNVKTGEIKMFRFGAGSDRTYTPQ